MSNYVKIFDTTLRDGEQSPGASMNKEEKIRLARKLAKLGVDIIEAGFPAASPGDFEAVQAIARDVKGPIICGLSRTRPADIERCWEAIQDAEKPRIHTFVATSDIHLQYKLQMTREQVLQEIKSGVSHARSMCEDVQWSAEDASRSDPDFLCQCVRVALEAGASTINIPDTVGYALPHEFYERISYIVEQVPEAKNATISVHCHDDLGMAVANSIAGVRAGARQVEGCINGIGERAGNASIEEVVMALATRQKELGLETGVTRSELYSTSRLVTMITGLPVQPNKAIVGANAFAHEAGIHVDGVLKQPLTYEIMTPEEVGVDQNTVVLGKHSGRAALRNWLKGNGYELDVEQCDRLFSAFKRLADKKKDIVDEDLEALIADEILRIPIRWELKYLNVMSGTEVEPVATVRIWDSGDEKRDAAFGNGPVDAVFNAILRITGSKAKLMRFSVASVTGGMDAQGEVTVRLQENGRVVLGKGADPDILVASAKAFLNGLNRLEYVSTHDSLVSPDEGRL